LLVVFPMPSPSLPILFTTIASSAWAYPLTNYPTEWPSLSSV
jgi:hypothetical protein